MATSTVLVSGVDEMVRALEQVEPRVAKTIQKKAARKAAKPLHKRARQLMVKKTGLSRKTLVIRALKRTRKGPIGVKVFTDPKKIIGNQSLYAYKRKGGKSFILNPHWLEFGVPGHLNWGKTAHPLAPQPFMRPAVDQTRSQVLQILMSEVVASIEFEVSALAMLNKSNNNTKESRKALGLYT